MFTEPQQTCTTLWFRSVSNNFHKQTRSFARNSSKRNSSNLTSQYHNSTASRWFSLALVKCSKWCSHANTCIFVGQQLHNYMECSVRSRVRWPKSWAASNFYWDVIWCNVPFVGDYRPCQYSSNLVFVGLRGFYTVLMSVRDSSLPGILFLLLSQKNREHLTPR